VIGQFLTTTALQPYATAIVDDALEGNEERIKLKVKLIKIKVKRRRTGIRTTSGQLIYRYNICNIYSLFVIIFVIDIINFFAHGKDEIKNE